MNHLSITVAGFPPTFNGVKLKLFVENRVGKDLLDYTIRNPDETVTFNFRDIEGLRKFESLDLQEIKFGTDAHQLRIIAGGSHEYSREQFHHQPPPQDADIWRRVLYVSEIPAHLHDRSAFLYHFKRFGDLDKCFLHPNKHFGIVTFLNHADALAALYGAVACGPGYYLKIQWSRKEVPSAAPCLPPHPTPARHHPMTGNQMRGPRRWSSNTDLRPKLTAGPHSSQGTRPTPRYHEMPTQSGAAAQSPRRSSAQNNIPSELELYEQTHFWSSLKSLPAEEGTVCILAQNISPSATLQKVKMHFESNKRSNGGPVQSIVRMIDGLLVVFQDPQNCESCLQMTDQIFDKERISIYRKEIPTYYEKKFIVEGVGKNTSCDTLTMFLESCSANETAPVCKKQAMPGLYLIEYGDDLDLSETSDILKKIERDQLEGSSLKASKLLRTDCLKVIGVESDVSNDKIKLTFESKKRTDGGPVTRVDRLQNKAVLVYFAAFKDAERVYERFKTPSTFEIEIGKQKVEVELYFHSLSREHETSSDGKTPKPTPRRKSSQGAKEDTSATSNQPLKNFDIQPNCKLAVLKFIHESPMQFDNLKQKYEGYATIQIQTERRVKQPPQVRFIPKKMEDPSVTQKAFNTECRNRFDAFIKDYSTVSHTVDQKVLQNARESKLSVYLDEEYKGSLMDVTVNWKKNTVEITGVKDKVNTLMEEITGVLKFKVQKMEINKEQHRIMVNCGIVDELRSRLPNVAVKADECIEFTGPSEKVQLAQVTALTMLNTVEKKKLAGLDNVVQRYLVGTVQASDILQALIENKFQNEGVKALLTFDDDEVWARVTNGSACQKAVKVIHKLFRVQTIAMDAAATPIIHTPLWKGFHQSLKDFGSATVYIKQNQSIIIVGPVDEIERFETMIMEFLDENVPRREVIRMEYGRARFIMEKSQFDLAECKTHNITCSLTAENGGGILMQGKKAALEKVKPVLIQLMRSIIEMPQTLRESGIKQYYQGDEGKDFLKTREHINKCIILASSKTCPEWERAAQRRYQVKERSPEPRSPVRTPQTPQEQLLVSVTLPNSGVKLQVLKTSIVTHACDVIINASNTSLELRSGGISGAIKQYDQNNGNKIERKMKELVKSNYGDFIPGDAVMTTAGNLPACKKIVHAVGPRWDSSYSDNPANALKDCIFESLKLTSKAGLKSIAIPAVSCGIFGGKSDVCCPLIVEAVIDYFKEETNSTITTVNFVENSRDVILKEFVESVKKHEVKQPASASPTPTPQPSTRAPSTQYQTRNSVTVSLRQGDLSNTAADVLVNITSRKGFPTMSGSAVSAALLQRGGTSIQAECGQLPGPHKLGGVYGTGSGNLPCKELYHGIVMNHSQHSEIIVRSIVSRSLRSADTSGYSSLAFPAIATGGFGYPANDVARWMREEISKFAPTSLTNVMIVLHPSSPGVTTVFQAEFNGSSASNPSQATATSASNFGQLSVNIYQGDITQETSDAIVNSTNAHFDLTQGMVSKAIISQGGQQIQNEIVTASGTEFRMTSGGNLPCSNIFHVATPNNETDIQKKVLLVLRDADANRLTSISFPALATGGIGVSSSKVAQAMRKAFEKFGQSVSNSLTTINVVIFDPNMLNDFKIGILSRQPQTIMNKVKATFNSLFGSIFASDENSTEESLDLYFYSDNQEAINKAIESVTKETKRQVHSRVIVDEAFDKLSEWELWEIKEIGVANEVKIKDRSNKYLKQFSVEGLMMDVMKAHEAIKDVLKEFTAAETTSIYVIWEKYTNGTWMQYHPRSAHVLDKAYKARNGNTTSPALNNIKVPEYRKYAVHMTLVDLSNLEGDPNGPNPPNVKRRVKERVVEDVLPKSWGPIPQGQPYLKVTLSTNSSEYRDVLQAFTSTGGTGNIIKIERIQHESQYKQYVAKKAEVKAKMSSGNPVERKLFHGTSSEDSIIRNGFDWRYAGKHGTAYGRGVYFATTASYSQGYASGNPSGHHCMFYANVITGDFTQGNSALLVAPIKQGNDHYDSVVNNVNSPSMFIIFKDANAYPSYLITYQ